MKPLHKQEEDQDMIEFQAACKRFQDAAKDYRFPWEALFFVVGYLLGVLSSYGR